MTGARRAVLDRKETRTVPTAAGASQESVADPRWPERKRAVGHCLPTARRGRGAQKSMISGSSSIASPIPATSFEGDAALQRRCARLRMVEASDAT
jgi:hypothetical protein